MVKYSQYFTEFKYAKSMISLLATLKVEKILDLGIGNASLSLAALQLWSNAHVDSVDIDENICKQIPLLHGNINVIHGDVIAEDNIKYFVPDSYDLAVCNPPYGVLRKGCDFQKIFVQANMQECIALKRLSADVVFIAKNIIYLKENGVLCAILPDGLLTRKDLLPFRKALLLHHEILKIIQLPEKSFSKTEARTHIVILRKNGATPALVEVGLFNVVGQVEEKIMVRREELQERMDFSFLKWQNKQEKITSNVLEGLEGLVVKRGSYSYKFLRSHFKSFLHSNSFKDGDILRFSDKLPNVETNKKVFAEAGDVIMCRVGKRSVGKVAYIEKGNILLSDCLYKITVPGFNGRKLFERLLGNDTKEWVNHCSHGVCSKVISKIDLVSYLCRLLRELCSTNVVKK